MTATGHSLAGRRACETGLERVRGTDWARVDLGAVFAAIKKAGIPLNPSSITKRYPEQVGKILYDQFGIDVQGPGFFAAMKKRFGSWEMTLKAVGENPVEHDRSMIRRLSVEEIVKAIQVWHQAGIALDNRSMRKKSTHALKLVKDAIGFEISPYAMYFRVRTSELKTWPAALKAAGVPVTDVLVHNKGEWTKERVIEVVQFLSQHFTDLNLIELEAQSAAIRRLTFDRFGTIIRPATLGKYARLFYGSWPGAVRAAGLNFQGIRWSTRGALDLASKKDLVFILKSLSTHYSDMNFTNIERDGMRLIHIMFDQFGFAAGPQVLEIAVRARFGSWIEGLQAAGLPTEGIRTRARGIPWTPELVSDLLYFLSKNRINLTLSEFLVRSKRVRDLTLKEYHKPFNVYAIYSAALAFYGGWYQALEAADLPLKSERRARITSDIVLMPHVVSWEKNADGSSRRVVQYGEGFVDPEQSLIEKEDHEALQSAMADLDQDQSRAAAALLNYLEAHDSLEDQAAVTAHLQKATGRSWSWAEVKNLLESLAGGLSSNRL